MPEIGDKLQPRSRAVWRRWLEKHGQSRKEIWLVLLKKHVKRPCVSYEEAVEEALCFGWIDGILKRIDDEKHAVRFTPRRPSSDWSDVNKRRVGKLMRAGKMAEPGLRAVRAGKKSGKWQRGSRRAATDTIPPELERGLARNRRARENFAELAPSHRRNYIGWILDAKREDTRRRRVRETVERVARGKKPGIE